MDMMQNESGERSSTVIKNVQVVSVPVGDQEPAKTFYVGTLGFELRADSSWGRVCAGWRWPPGAPRLR
jgi:hypothetical protein